MNPVARAQMLIGLSSFFSLLALIIFFGAAKVTEGLVANVSVAIFIAAGLIVQYRVFRATWGRLLVPEAELRRSRVSATIEYPVGDRRVTLRQDGTPADCDDFLAKYDVTPSRRTDSA